MKKAGILLMMMLVSAALVFAGCGTSDAQQNQEQQQQQDVQQNADGADAQNEANPAGAEAQNTPAEIVTLNGQFQGLADGHSAEVLVNEEPTVFQFYDETIAGQLEIMETGTAIQFDVETDAETGVKTIVKLYESAE